MRITNNTMNNTFLNNVNKNMRRMLKAQEQATSGKAVSRPSDNPLLVGKILSMRENIEQNKQYNTNINNSIGWVSTQDTALNDATKAIHRVTDLIRKAANGPLSTEGRNAVKDEMEMQVDALKDILNTNYDGRYIFAGQATDKPPFSVVVTPAVEADPPTDPPTYDKLEERILKYNGHKSDIEREIAQGVTIDIQANGDRIMSAGKYDDKNLDLGVFLNDVIQAMEGDDTEALSGDLLGKADKILDNLLQVRSKVGATHNRLESAEERNTEENTNLSAVLSEKEDVDLAESYMNYIMMTTAYQASLSMGAKILQPSLLDYLR